MTVGVDAVLRAQGLPSGAPRRATVVAAAEQALRDALPHLQPAGTVRRFAVEGVSHARVRLAEGGVLAGPLPASQLAGAREVFVVAATVGGTIGDVIREASGVSPSRALALEGAAVAGLDEWAARVRGSLEVLAGERQWRLSASLSPGMEGWPLEDGQRQVFALLGNDGPVRWRDGGMMWPRHSVSFVAGMGPDLAGTGDPCDWCGARLRCRHRPPSIR